MLCGGEERSGGRGEGEHRGRNIGIDKTSKKNIGGKILKKNIGCDKVTKIADDIVDKNFGQDEKIDREHRAKDN